MQLVLDAPLPPTIDDDAPGADYWLDDDAEADELEACVRVQGVGFGVQGLGFGLRL